MARLAEQQAEFSAVEENLDAAPANYYNQASFHTHVFIHTQETAEPCQFSRAELVDYLEFRRV